MTESAYSLFKRPAIISGRPFRKSDRSMTGVYVAQNHYSANIPQKINLAAFPRQLIADKGSFDVMKTGKRRDDVVKSPLFYADCATLEYWGSGVASRHHFRAALTGQCFRQFDCKTDCFDGGGPVQGTEAWFGRYWLDCNCSDIDQSHAVGMVSTP